MAYLPIEDEDENQGQPQQGAEKVLGGESSVVGSGGGGASGGSAPATPKGTSSGSGWTNLTSYVKANEGADKTMGQAVQGKFNERADKSQSTVNTYGTMGEKTIADKTVTDNGVVAALSGIQPKEMKVPGATPAPGRGPQPTAATTTPKDTTRGGGVQTAAPAPAPAAAAYTPDLVSSFTNQIAGYTGPARQDEIDGYGQAASAVDQTGANADMAQDFEGRRGYLREAYSDPKYTSGEQRLDSFITGAGAGGREALDAVNTSAEGQRTGWKDLIGRLGDGITTARTTSDKTKADTLAAFGDASGRLGTAFDEAEKAVTATNDKNTAAFTAATTAIASKDPTKQAWGFKQAGIDPEVGAYLLSLKIPASTIISQGGSLGLGDIAGDDNQASYNFLSELATAGKLDPLAARDFTKTGASGNAYDLNDDLIASGSGARGLEQDFTGRLTSAQDKRDFEFDQMQAGLASGIGADRDKVIDTLHSQGVSRGLIEQAQTMGVDVSQFMKKGSKLQLGDVLSDKDRKGWSDLMGKLGAKSNLSTKDIQDEGAAWNFDKAGFEAALAAAVAEKGRQFQIQEAKKGQTAAATAAAAAGKPKTATPLKKKIDYRGGF